MGERGGQRGWAAVTGASSGIGEAFARALSTDGFGVVLVARGQEELARVAAGLPGPSEVLVADLARPEDVAAVEARLAIDGPSRVRMLVNNAATGQWGPFTEQPAAQVAETVAVNAVAAARLSRAVLPGMIAAGTGGLITVSSPAGERPAPGLAVYGASKAFLDALDTSLRAELDAAGSSITVTTVRPGWTRTGFHRRLAQDVDSVPSGQWGDADGVAREALRRHGLGHRRVRVPEPSLRQRALDQARRARRGLPGPVKALVRTLRR